MGHCCRHAERIYHPVGFRVLDSGSALCDLNRRDDHSAVVVFLFKVSFQRFKTCTFLFNGVCSEYGISNSCLKICRYFLKWNNNCILKTKFSTWGFSKFRNCLQRSWRGNDVNGSGWGILVSSSFRLQSAKWKFRKKLPFHCSDSYLFKRNFIWIVSWSLSGWLSAMVILQVRLDLNGFGSVDAGIQMDDLTFASWTERCKGFRRGQRMSMFMGNWQDCLGFHGHWLPVTWRGLQKGKNKHYF